MDNSNKSKLFTFGKLENNEDSDSEDSPYDSADDDSILENKASENSSETITNHQWLAKEMGKLNSTGRPTSSYTSSSSSYDFYKRRNHNGSSTDTIEPRPRHEIYTERQNPFVIDQRQKGNWSLRCDNLERNSDDMTEADIIWAAINDLVEKEPSIFFLKPDKFISKDGYASMNLYTPDFRDEELILKAANVLRKKVFFPYIIYYYKTGWKSQSIYMHTPNGEFYRKNENNKWDIVDRE